MKYIETFSNITHTWNRLADIFYQRYPNPFSKHVLSEDVVLRKIENDTLKTVRLYSKTNETPSWLKIILPATTAYILEESHVNLKEKTIVTYTKNLNLKTFLHVEEKCVYSLSKESSEWTSVHRQAWIMSGFYGLATAFESFGAKRYSSNIQRSHRGFESAIQKQTYEKPSTTQTSFSFPLSNSCA